MSSCLNARAAKTCCIERFRCPIGGMMPLPVISKTDPQIFIWLQGLEKYLMTKIYHKSFAVSPIDRSDQLAGQMRADIITDLMSYPFVCHICTCLILVQSRCSQRIQNSQTPKIQMTGPQINFAFQTGSQMGQLSYAAFNRGLRYIHSSFIWRRFKPRLTGSSVCLPSKAVEKMFHSRALS